MYKFLMILVLLAFGCASVSAQGVATVKNKLAVDAANGGVVHINESESAAAAVSALSSTAKTDPKVRVYRIRIFFEKSQDARMLSSSVVAKFKAQHPGVPVQLNYEAPYFKVTVGNCLSSEEVLALWAKVKEGFPSAFVVNEETSLSAFKD